MGLGVRVEAYERHLQQSQPDDPHNRGGDALENSSYAHHGIVGRLHEHDLRSDEHDEAEYQRPSSRTIAL